MFVFRTIFMNWSKLISASAPANVQTFRSEVQTMSTAFYHFNNHEGYKVHVVTEITVKGGGEDDRSIQYFKLLSVIHIRD